MPAQPSIGLLLLDNGFERIPGDVGHPATWRFPVRRATVPGVTAAMVAQGGPALVEPFVRAGLHLVEQGVAAIATSCGFLAALQPELSARLPVPVATSALLQIPAVSRLLPPGRTVGILASLGGSLAPQLNALDLPATLPVVGLADDAAMLRDLRAGRSPIPVEAHRQDVLAAAQRLLRAHPQVGAIVLECANFPPHSQALAAATGLPIFDTVSLVNWLYAALVPWHPSEVSGAVS
ncbi:aspartate/glutamate racemase family protein [Hydrogenophaga sp. OTU3427]|uniref:aspartate/glutamate racemase family protein n=1 Tax=Hydrogenophaga sp. OTU3427 TaxID=3043856 RepID=UPI00313B7F3C